MHAQMDPSAVGEHHHYSWSLKGSSSAHSLPRWWGTQAQTKQHASSTNPTSSHKSPLCPLPFQICSAGRRGCHPSLVSPWAQHCPSSQHRALGLGPLAAQKCDCFSQSNYIGQTSFSLTLPLFGVWDDRQRLGHRRCPSAHPLQRGRTHTVRAQAALRGQPDISTACLP